MKTPAIIASLTVAGSIAFAAGQQSGGKPSPPMPSGAPAHFMQEEMPEARMAQAAGGCQSKGADKIWFTTVHPLPTYCYFPAQGYTADINGDGTPEYMLSVGGYLIVNGQEEQNACLGSVSEVTIQQGNLAASYSCVVASAAVTAYARAVFPQALCVEFTGGFSGSLRDMDADGDLDLIGIIRVSLVGESGYCNSTMETDRRYIWIENTGYERPVPPVAADLNRDGKVDGADLGMLLLAWGPNP